MRLIERKVAATLRQYGYKLTPQRRAVIQTIASTQDHLTPTAIYEKVHQEHQNIGFVTIYRTLEILDKVGLICEVHAGGNAASLSAHREAMESLSRARPLTVLDTPLRERPAHGVVLVLSGAEVVLPLEGVDLAAERKRLESEVAEAGGEISRLEILLGRESFRSKAPEEVVEREQQRLSSQQERLERLARILGLLADS